MRKRGLGDTAQDAEHDTARSSRNRTNGWNRWNVRISSEIDWALTGTCWAATVGGSVATHAR